MKLSKSLVSALIKGGMSRKQIEENVAKGVYEVSRRFEEEMAASLENALTKAANAADGLSMISNRAKDAAQIINLLSQVRSILDGSAEQKIA